MSPQSIASTSVRASIGVYSILGSADQSMHLPAEMLKRLAQHLPACCGEFASLLSVLAEARNPLPGDLAGAVASLPEESPSLPLPVINELLDLIPAYQREVWLLRHVFNPLIRDDEMVRESIAEERSVEGRSPHQPGWYFRLDYDGESPVWSAKNRQVGECLIDDPPAVKMFLLYDTASGEQRFLVWPENPMQIVEASDALDLSAAFCRILECLCTKCALGRTEGAYKLSDPGWWHKTFRAPAPEAMKAVVASLLNHSQNVIAFHDGWANLDRRVWLAACLGDWLTAHATALAQGDGRLATVTGPRAERWLQRVERDATGPFVLRSVSDETKLTLLRHKFEPVVRLLQECEFLLLIRPMLEVVLEHDLPGWDEEVEDLFFRHEKHSATTFYTLAARYLVLRGIRTSEVVESLSRDQCNPERHWSNLALALVLQHRPDLGRESIQAALQSPIDDIRIRAIAALVVTAPTWSVEDLREALDEKSSRLVRECILIALEGLNAPEKDRTLPANLRYRNRKQLLRVRLVPAPEFKDCRCDLSVDDFLERDQRPGLPPRHRRVIGTVSDFFAEQTEMLRRWLSPGEPIRE